MKTGTISKILIACTPVAIFAFVNCSAVAPKTTAASSGSSTSASAIGKVAITITNSQGAVVYADGTSNSALNLVAGQTYKLQVIASDAPAGTTFILQSTQTNVVAGSSLTIPLELGSNTLTIPLQGDYAWKIVATPPGQAAVTNSYIASVSCSAPTLTANTLNPSQISVTAGSGSNLYNFSGAGVVAEANGTPPYTCAWDPTGTGIQDTAFQSCGTVASNIYVNYVSSRNVGLLVKDSCNTTIAVSKVVNLAYTEPAMPGNIFIYGVVSNALGSAANDPRISGVTYLATNSGGNNIVQPSYSNGTFNIYSLMDYGMPSSVKFGMQIQVTGITDTLNVATGTGTVNVSNAAIHSLTYSTDQSGDQNPTVSLTAGSCTLTNQGAVVHFITGQPCSAGTTGDNNQATVEIYGHYNCPSVSNASGSASIEGDFDGYATLVDNCSGGGGGGGGGIAPISL
jgi:hypothetical protein